MSSPSPSAQYSSEHYSGGGSLYSTLPDYSKLLNVFLMRVYGTEKILSTIAVDLILQVKLIHQT